MVNWTDRNYGKIWFHQSVPGDDICDGTSDTLFVTMEGTPDSVISLFPERRSFQIGELFQLVLEVDSLYEYVSWGMDGEIIKDSARLDEAFDFQYSCPGSHQLEVTAFHEYGSCTNQAYLSSQFTIVPPRPEIIRVTSDTSQDLRMDITWSIHDDDFGNFERSLTRTGKDGRISTKLTDTQNELIEYGTNTGFQYEYFLSLSDVGCEKETTSDSHFNSVLAATVQENSNRVELEWSPYVGWQNGVHSYEVFLSIDGFPIEMLGNTDNHSFTIQREPIGFDYCFRIKALENGGNNSYSWSNESCVSFVPELYAYNVFTPNGDELNPTFVIDNVEAYRKSKLLIIDRNGNTVFEQVNYQNDWDGGDLPSGVYYFLLELNEPLVDQQSINGYFHIIR